MFKTLLKLIVTVSLTGGAYFCATIYPQAWILMWFAVLPVCLYALQESIGKTILAGFLAFFIGSAADLVIYWRTILPITEFLYPDIIKALVYTALLLLFRYIALSPLPWLASFVFASGWVVCDFIPSFTFFPYIGGETYANIAYTQLLNLPILQLASITGIWGITFLLTLLPASITLAWHYKNIAKFNYLTVLFPPLLLLILVLLFGAYRLLTPLPKAALKIGMANPPISRDAIIEATDTFTLTPKTSQANFATIKNSIKEIEILAKDKVDVVLLPEAIAVILQSDNDHILQLLSATAKRNKITLIMGLVIKENGKTYNSAYMFLPNGTIALRHDKWHLVPIESRAFSAGNKNSILKTKDRGIWGVLICRDMDYEQPARQYGKEGVNILFVPAWDFYYDDWMHARYSYMRAVENGFAVARAGRAGLLTLTDSRGRMVSMLSTTVMPIEKNKSPTLTGALNIGEGNTFYSRHGGWFGWLCVLIFFMGIFTLFKRNKISHTNKFHP